jgi:glycosyltransferase involved in cell wall biosynthesis
MKIVHIITRMILGGAQENTLLTCEGFHRRGHEVTLITGPALGPEGQLMDRAHNGGYKVIELDCLRRQINPIHDLPGYFKLKRILSELQPDIVHTHSAKGGILGRWAAAALRNKTDQVCCRALGELRKAQNQACALPRIVHSIHGLAFHPYQSNRLNRLYIAIEKNAAKNTDAFICVADAMTEQALKAGIGRPEQFTRVFSGLETQNYLNQPSSEEMANLRNGLNIPSLAIVIASVARLTDLKGHEYIIESAKQITQKHKNIVWLFIGDGRLRHQIEQQIAQNKLQNNFRLTGLVPPENVGPLLHASDILVHCSLREGLARALPQALLCGKPVISYDVDGAREVIINDQTGYLIPPKDVRALTIAQEKLIADKDLRIRLGNTGRDFCRKEFDHETMIDRIEQVYDTLL